MAVNARPLLNHAQLPAEDRFPSGGQRSVALSNTLTVKNRQNGVPTPAFAPWRRENPITRCARQSVVLRHALAK